VSSRWKGLSLRSAARPMAQIGTARPQGPSGEGRRRQLLQYTCINWLRTLPYVRAWAQTYERHGLVVIGVHTPEFSFEHDLENVRTALKEMEVTYPIAVDNDYAVWTAFSNNYWPAPVLHRRGGTHPTPLVRRGRLRAFGAHHPAAPQGRRSGGCDRRARVDRSS
jgi:hypothetical protein